MHTIVVFALVPITSHVDCGMTTPVFGRTQYFLGLVVFTCETKKSQYKLN